MICQEFNEALLEAVDYAFSSLGESCRRALYFHLERTFRLPRRQIPERSEEFDEALKTIFKRGAVFLEKLILRKLCEMLGVSAVEDDALDFVESISMIRSISASSVTSVPSFSEVTSTARKTRRGEYLKQRPSVLVVDDDAVIRKTLSQILKTEGYYVLTAETGKQAIAASKKRFFNVALIDVRLQDMEGTALIDKLKETEPRMIRIIVTGYPSMDSAIEAVNRNADGYILKPVDVQELLAMVERQLKKQREDLEYSEGKVAQYIETRVKNLELEMDRNR
jgi:ActR/RegA family two-component response regulator